MAESSAYAGALQHASLLVVVSQRKLRAWKPSSKIELLGSGMLYQKHGEKAGEMTSRKLELQLRSQFPGQIQNLPPIDGYDCK